MASFVYDKAKEAIAKATLGDLSAMDLRTIHVMTDTNADALAKQQAAVFVSDIDTLDEYDGAGEARQDLAGVTVNLNTTTHRAQVKATSYTMTGVSAGTRANQGLILYKHVTNDADSVVIAYFECSFTGNGGDITINIDATDGLFYI